MVAGSPGLGLFGDGFRVFSSQNSDGVLRWRRRTVRLDGDASCWECLLRECKIFALPFQAKRISCSC